MIVGGDDYLGGLAAVRALHMAGYAPWGAISRPWSYVARSRLTAGRIQVPEPRQDPEGYAQAILEAAAELDPVAILTGSDIELGLLAERREELPASARAGVPTPAMLDRITDKWGLATAAGGVGLSSPPTAVLELHAGRRDESPFGYPVIVKAQSSAVPAPEGLCFVSTRRADSEHELHALLAEMPGARALLQPALEGSLYTINGVAFEGRLVCAVHQRAMRTWPPGAGVLASAVTVPRDRSLEARVADLLAALGWSGIFNLQFVEAPDGRQLIDFNGRTYHSMALAVASGLNLPAIWIERLGGGESRPGEYQVGVRFRAEAEDLLALHSGWRRGHRLAVAGALLPRRRSVLGAFAWRDPYPLRTALGKLRGGLREAR